MKKLFMYSLIFFMFGCSSVMDWQTKYPDNPIEEIIEEGIKNISGEEIDLTPVTGEEIQKINTPNINVQIRIFKY